MTDTKNHTEQAMLDMADDFKEVIADKDKIIEKLTHTIVNLQCQRIEDVENIDVIFNSTYAIAMSLCANLDQINTIANTHPMLLNSHCEDVVCDIHSRHENDLFKLRKLWLEMKKMKNLNKSHDHIVIDEDDELAINF